MTSDPTASGASGATDASSRPVPAESMDPERWLDDHGDALFAYAMRRVRDRTVAEDLVQETFVTAIRRRDDFEGRSALRTWLVGILRNKLLQHLQRSSSRPLLDDLPPTVVDDAFSKLGKWKQKPEAWGTDPEAAALQTELHAALGRCMKKLPARSAEAIQAIEQPGMTGETLARMLDVAPSNVYVILYRARSALRQCLERSGVALPLTR